MRFMEFKSAIKKICEIEGINLKDFSRLTGIPYDTVKGYSQGKREPSLSQLKKIAEAPPFSKYVELLIPTQGITSEEAEFMALFRQVCDSGQGEEALKYLKYLAEREGK